MRRPTSVRGLLWATLLSPCVLSGPAPVSRRPRAAGAQVWTITVGIDNYANGAIPDSRTAARNAQRVQQWIRRIGWDCAAPAPPERLRYQRSRRGRGAVGEHPAHPAEPGLGVPAMARRERTHRRHGGLLLRRGIPDGVQAPGRGLDVQHYLLPMDANPRTSSRPAGRSNARLTSASGTSSGSSAGWPPRPPRRRRPQPRSRPRRRTRPAAAARPAAGGSPGIAWLSRLALARGDGLAGLRPSPRGARRQVQRPGHRVHRGAPGGPGGLRTRQPGIRRPNLAAWLSDLQEDCAAQAPGFPLPGRRPALDDLVAQRWQGPGRSRAPSWSSRPVTPTR